MQQHIAHQSSTKVASDPSRKIVYFYIIFVGALLALFIGSMFFPASWRDELFFQTPNIQRAIDSSPLSLLVYPFFQATLLLPFLNLSVSAWLFLWPFGGRWKHLERDRQQAAAHRLNGKTPPRFSLPETFAPLPPTLSVQLRRNWRATWIAGVIYVLLIGIVLWAFISGWFLNIQYLAQRGEISPWTLLGSIPSTLVCCWCVVPALSAFVLAPRQYLIATQDGLIGYRGLCLRVIPWQEARLFALIAKQETLVYELASSTTLIRWSSKPAWSYGAHGLRNEIR